MRTCQTAGLRQTKLGNGAITSDSLSVGFYHFVEVLLLPHRSSSLFSQPLLGLTNGKRVFWPLIVDAGLARILFDQFFCFFLSVQVILHDRQWWPFRTVLRASHLLVCQFLLFGKLIRLGWCQLAEHFRFLQSIDPFKLVLLEVILSCLLRDMERFLLTV